MVEDVGRLRVWKEERMMENGTPTIVKKSVSCTRVLCIYKTLLAAHKGIRTTRLSTEHSLFLLLHGPNMHSQDEQNRFQHSLSTITKVFHQGLDALLNSWPQRTRRASAKSRTDFLGTGFLFLAFVASQ